MNKLEELKDKLEKPNKLSPIEAIVITSIINYYENNFENDDDDMEVNLSTSANNAIEELQEEVTQVVIDLFGEDILW